VSESCHTCEGGMSHTWMRHVTYVYKSCHTNEWVISHTRMGHVTHVNTSCHAAFLAHEYILNWEPFPLHNNPKVSTKKGLSCLKRSRLLPHKEPYIFTKRALRFRKKSLTFSQKESCAVFRPKQVYHVSQKVDHVSIMSQKEPFISTKRALKFHTKKVATW